MWRDDGVGVVGCGSGKRQLRICQSEWKEHVTSTKDGRVRGSRSRDEQ